MSQVNAGISSICRFLFSFAYFKMENQREVENQFLKLKLYFNQSLSTLFYLPFFSLYLLTFIIYITGVNCSMLNAFALHAVKGLSHDT
jgi:hypothetical protein